MMLQALHLSTIRWRGYCCLRVGLLARPLGAAAQVPPPGTDYLTPLKTKNLSYLWSANPCGATWTSYATRQRKSCPWGDFKIPESGNLDFSVRDFEVAKKHVPNGCQTYMAALEGNDDSPQTRQTRAEEKRAWWK